MSKKLFFMISVMILAGFAGSAFAETVTNWTNAGADNLWTTVGNWSNGLPTSVYGDGKAKMVRLFPDHAVIAEGMNASTTWLVIGDNAAGEVRMTGGNLKVESGTGGDTWTIFAYAPTDTGIFTMDGGSVTTTNRFYVGFGGSGTLNMNAGTITIGGVFGIGYGEGQTSSIGRVYLTGGTITVTSTAATNLNMANNAKLDITGGTLILAGDKRTLVNGYVISNYITAFNGLGDVVATYDGTNTTVIGQTNPFKSRGPNPANSATDVPPYSVLTWTAGDTALTHDVYFGTDATAVNDANTSTAGIYQGSQPRDSNSFAPAVLELGKAYYWRVDEVNDTQVYKGNLWQFVVSQNAAIDTFESYADSAAMLGEWSNGGTAATLSLVTTGGKDKPQAMKLDYNNANTPLFSEAQTGGPTVDWTVQGVVAVDIWYKGDAANAAVPMYAALEDNESHPVAIVVNSDPNLLATEWKVWHIQLSDFAGVNLENVKKLYIGFGDRTNPVAGGAGTIYIDDIRLYVARCLYAPAEDLNDDCVVDFEDFAVLAGNWMQLSQI